MTGLDLALLGGLVVVGAAVSRHGVRNRTRSWIGAIAGLAFGFFLAWAATSGLSGWAAAAVAFVSVVVPLIAGWWWGRATDKTPIYRAAPPSDQALGAALGVLASVVFVWFFADVLLALPGRAGARAGESTLIEFLHDVPGPPDPFRDISARVADEPELQQRAGRPVEPIDEGPPVVPSIPDDSGLGREVLEELGASVVRISGASCGQAVSATGFVVRDGLVATNAHVVAGMEDVGVVDAAGTEIAGRTVWFDPGSDLALVAVSGLDAPPLELREAVGGEVGAVLAPASGDRAQDAPFKIAGAVTGTGVDIFGDPDAVRRVLYVAAALGTGDSGAPLATANGVLGMVFAVAPDDPGLAFALASSEISAAVERVAIEGPTVDTSRCL